MIEPPCACVALKPATPSATMAEPPEWSNLLSITDNAVYTRRRAEFYRESARHEAGHAICAMAHGRGVLWITIGDGRPACGYDQNRIGEATIDAASITTCAGVVAGGQACPSWSELHHAMRRARAGIDGTCDVCQNARLFAATVAHLDDGEIVEKWFETYAAAADLFRSPAWSGALDALAPALERETLLTGPAIMEIIKGYELTAPLANLPAIWTQAS